jgi:sialate O-acetylesterase
MQGVGDNRPAIREAPSAQIYAFGMNDRWRLAREPLHWLPGSVDPVHNEAAREPGWTPPPLPAPDAFTKGINAGMYFARAMLEGAGRPVGLVPCAHGGTSMDQWDPALRDEGGESLYGSMYRRVQAVGGKVRGVVWYQGESDAAPGVAEAFTDKFIRFIEAVRRDFDDPDLPVYYVQIGRFAVVNPDLAPHWDTVRGAQLAIADEVDHVAVAPAIDLELDDLIHIGSFGQRQLGRRLARLALADLYATGLETAGPALHGPRPVEATRHETPYGEEIHVRFEGVNGELRTAPAEALPNGRVSGFSLSGADGSPIAGILDQRIHPTRRDTVVLSVQFTFDPNAPAPEPLHVWYGRGLDPFCNLTDALDMGCPAFGNLPVRPPAE